MNLDTGPWSVSEAEYHSCTETISHSQAEVFLRDPAEFEWLFVTRRGSRKPTPAMLAGTTYHQALLGQRDWSGRITRIPEDVLGVQGRKAGKAWQKFREDHPGQQLLLAHEYDELSALRDAIWENESAAGLLAQCQPELWEQAYRWRDPQTELWLRCKPDGMGPIAIADLKSTRDARPDAFRKSINQYGYHRQAAWYLDGLAACGFEPRPFVFLAFTKQPPFRVCCYDLDERYLELARRENRRILQRIAQCRQTGRWRDPSHGQVIRLVPALWEVKASEVEYGERSGERSDERDGTQGGERDLGSGYPEECPY